MNYTFLLAKIAALGGAILLIEGANLASGGDIYLASVARLAQMTEGSLQPPPPPPPPPSDSSSIQPAPTPISGGESGGTLPPPPTGGNQLPPPPSGMPFEPSGFGGQSGQPGQFQQPGMPFQQPGQFQPQQFQQFQQPQQQRQPRFQFQPQEPQQFQQPQQPRFQFREVFSPQESGSMNGQTKQPSGQPFQGDGFKPPAKQPSGQPFQSGGFMPSGLNGEQSGQSQGQPRSQEQFGEPSESEFDESMEQEEERVDPREIREVLQRIQEIQKQIASLLRQAKKAAANSDDVARLNAIAAELNQTKTILSNSGADAEDQRAAIQEFHDSNYWEEIDEIRAKIELPTFVKQLEKSLTQLKKVIRQKATQTLGFNMGQISAVVAEMEADLAAVKTSMANSDWEEARDLMQALREEGKNPQEIQSIILGVREIRTMMKRARKNADLSAQIESALREIFGEFNAGNYQEAREAVEELKQEVRRLTQSNSKR